MAESIAKYWHESFDTVMDLSKGWLRTVRTPTPQMDVFSVVIQIGADHLLSENSSHNDVVTF